LTGFVHFFPFVYFNCANPSRNPINTIKLNETFGFI